MIMYSALGTGVVTSAVFVAFGVSGLDDKGSGGSMY